MKRSVIMSDILNEFLNEEETKQQAACIYSLLMGDFRPEFLSPSAKRVKSVFDPSNPNLFEQLYGNGYDAYGRLCERLHPGEEEDRDVEELWGSALQMCEYMGGLMYGYGRYYALHPEEFPAIPPEG